MRFLIVTADDFGLSEAVSLGILEAMNRGVVRSTSAMLCTEAGATLLAHHAHELRGRAGVHLQLTGGVPCAPRERIPSLLSGGSFPRGRGELLEPRADEIETEWRAQMEAFRDCGLQPTHIDTHQHVHKSPEVFAAYCRIARDYGVPARSCGPAMTRALRAADVCCADGFEDGWTGRACSAEDLLRRVDAAFECDGAEIVEVMSHPGYCDPTLAGRSTMVETRLLELTTLCDPQLPGLLRSREIGLDDWSVVQRRRVS